MLITPPSTTTSTQPISMISAGGSRPVVSMSITRNRTRRISLAPAPGRAAFSVIREHFQRVGARGAGLLFHEGCKGGGMIRVPARQCGAVLDHVTGGPQDAALVDRAGDVVVRAEDVEVAVLE